MCTELAEQLLMVFTITAYILCANSIVLIMVLIKQIIEMSGEKDG